MAYDFTSTFIVNTNQDSSGKALWSATPASAGPPAVVGSFNFKRSLNFLEPRVAMINKRAYSAPQLAKAVIDLTTLTDNGHYRLALYIRLSGSVNSYYSNDLVFKGVPRYVEFEKTASDTAATLATKIANQIRKWQVMYDHAIITAVANGNNIELNATDEYQRFTKVDIELYNESSTALYAPHFEVVQSAKLATDPEYDGKNTITQGVEGFGTYEFILHNLRLPTIENSRWESITGAEMPVPGGTYNQYTIHYVANRGTFVGGAIGQLVKSKTTHVFYVLTSLAADFEAALANVGTIEEETRP